MVVGALLSTGQQLATGEFTGEFTGDVAVRDAEDLQVLRRGPQALDDIVTALAVDPDGTVLAAAGLAGPIRVFDLATMRLAHEALEGHRSLVSGPGLAPDGTLVSASTDGTVRLWDSESGDPIGGPIPTGGADFPSVSVDGSTAVCRGVPGD